MASLLKSVEVGLERLARFGLFPSLARLVKRIAVQPRYLLEAAACRKGYNRFGGRYPQKIIFVAGLPKSGTTWLAELLGSYEGFHSLNFPGAMVHERKTGGTHDYDLPPDFFQGCGKMLAVIKMHIPASPRNLETLTAAKVKYAVLHRDLRDVAVSFCFFIKQRPWHPEHNLYVDLSIQEGLALFADRLLEPYADWIKVWHKNLDPDMGIELRYEDMLEDINGVIERVALHFELDGSLATRRRIIEHNDAGRQNNSFLKSFFRKGIARDWKNHFTPELADRYQKVIDTLP